jgi:hypothetical protein
MTDTLAVAGIRRQSVYGSAPNSNCRLIDIDCGQKYKPATLDGGHLLTGIVLEIIQ